MNLNKFDKIFEDLFHQDYIASTDNKYGFDLIHELKTKDFIYQSQSSVYKLTEKGYEVKEKGSYKAYLESLKDENERKEQREFEAHTANLTASKAAEKSTKYSRNSMIAAWVAGIPAVLSFLLSFQQYRESKNKDILVDSLAKKYAKIEGKYVVQQQILQKTKVRIDSLLHSQRTKQK